MSNSTEWQAAVHSALNDTHEDAWKDIEGKAEQLRAKAEARAPKLTGAGAASIEVSKGTDEEGRFVEVGTDVEYMLHQEFGTSVDQAQPFMRPAMEEVASQ